MCVIGMLADTCVYVCVCVCVYACVYVVRNRSELIVTDSNSNVVCFDKNGQELWEQRISGHTNHVRTQRIHSSPTHITHVYVCVSVCVCVCVCVWCGVLLLYVCIIAACCVLVFRRR